MRSPDTRIKAPQPPAPLRGNERGSFTEDTLSRRLPGIARSLLKEKWHPQAQSGLAALADEMPHSRLRPIHDPGAPDSDRWQVDLQPFLGQSWLDAPWFLAEAYFFRRILEATGYFQPGPGQGVDPYRVLKAQALTGVVEQLEALNTRLEKLIASDGEAQLRAALIHLLHTVLWGNRADLSIFPAGAGSLTEDQLRSGLLLDEAAAAVEYILGRPGGLAQATFILDNVGLELAYDLLLADFLLSQGLTGQVSLHAKPYPTYVSDAMISDIQALVAYLTGAASPAVQRLGRRLQGYLQEDRLHLQDDFFWTSPLPGWEMPPELRQMLASADLLISKGDANYRRWLGDRHWPFTAPIQQVVAYRPAPLLLLRVMKSEIVAGLMPGQPEKMYQVDPSWLFSGRSALIQFVR
jgi:uncharacterized protein with ATP-grasp and redox domains